MSQLPLLVEAFVWLVAGGALAFLFVLVMACYEWNMGAHWPYPQQADAP